MHGIEYTKHGLKRLLNSHDYLLIVDVEHTCDIHEHIPPSEREIIELGAVVICTQSLLVIDEFQCLVKPIVHPILSNFCIELTGIKQVEVESSDEFPVVFKNFLSWQAKYSNLLFVHGGHTTKSS